MILNLPESRFAEPQILGWFLRRISAAVHRDARPAQEALAAQIDEDFARRLFSGTLPFSSRDLAACSPALDALRPHWEVAVSWWETAEADVAGALAPLLAALNPVGALPAFERRAAAEGALEEIALLVGLLDGAITIGDPALDLARRLFDASENLDEELRLQTAPNMLAMLAAVQEGHATAAMVDLIFEVFFAPDPDGEQAPPIELELFLGTTLSRFTRSGVGLVLVEALTRRDGGVRLDRAGDLFLAGAPRSELGKALRRKGASRLESVATLLEPVAALRPTGPALVYAAALCEAVPAQASSGGQEAVANCAAAALLEHLATPAEQLQALPTQRQLELLRWPTPARPNEETLIEAVVEDEATATDELRAILAAELEDAPNDINRSTDAALLGRLGGEQAATALFEALAATPRTEDPNAGVLSGLANLGATGERVLLERWAELPLNTIDDALSVLSVVGGEAAATHVVALLGDNRKDAERQNTLALCGEAVPSPELLAALEPALTAGAPGAIVANAAVRALSGDALEGEAAEPAAELLWYAAVSPSALTDPEGVYPIRCDACGQVAYSALYRLSVGPDFAGLPWLGDELVCGSCERTGPFVLTENGAERVLEMAAAYYDPDDEEPPVQVVPVNLPGGRVVGPSEGIPALMKKAVADPNDLWVATELADSLAAAGPASLAAGSAERLLALRPDALRARLVKVKALVELERDEEASALLHETWEHRDRWQLLGRENQEELAAMFLRFWQALPPVDEPKTPVSEETVQSALKGAAVTRTHSAAPASPQKKVGRNDPCPCGSGKKHKKCCLRK